MEAGGPEAGGVGVMTEAEVGVTSQKLGRLYYWLGARGGLGAKDT